MNTTPLQLIDFLDANQIGLWLDSLSDDHLRALEWRFDHAAALCGRIRFTRDIRRNNQVIADTEVASV